MQHTLTFSSLFEYDTNKTGITIPLKLTHGNRQTTLLAKLDTGSSFCIFRRERGEALGLEIEHGYLQRIALADGFSFAVYRHDVTISALGFELDVMVYFAADYAFSREVLGQQGWLRQMRIAIVDYEGKLYISKYSD